jgi:SAM-dependent methyltransferase
MREVLEVHKALAARSAEQILRTCAPFLRGPAADLEVLDVGCGFGRTAMELGRRCRRVVGVEPSSDLCSTAEEERRACGLDNVAFLLRSVYELDAPGQFDLAVLDNVLEHLPDQPGALRAISESLRPGGVLFVLVPNKLWPIEVHYGLPFLSYLPLHWANFYLRLTGRGRDYTDASYAPTYFGLRRLLNARPELSYQFVLPADITLAMVGGAWYYRLGVALLRRWPWLWAISKAFLVVAVKR